MVSQEVLSGLRFAVKYDLLGCASVSPIDAVGEGARRCVTGVNYVNRKVWVGALALGCVHGDNAGRACGRVRGMKGHPTGGLSTGFCCLRSRHYCHGVSNHDEPGAHQRCQQCPDCARSSSCRLPSRRACYEGSRSGEESLHGSPPQGSSRSLDRACKTSRNRARHPELTYVEEAGLSTLG